MLHNSSHSSTICRTSVRDVKTHASSNPVKSLSRERSICASWVPFLGSLKCSRTPRILPQLISAAGPGVLTYVTTFCSNSGVNVRRISILGVSIKTRPIQSSGERR